jgi:hypothetical protein
MEKINSNPDNTSEQSLKINHETDLPPKVTAHLETLTSGNSKSKFKTAYRTIAAVCDEVNEAVLEKLIKNHPAKPREDKKRHEQERDDKSEGDVPQNRRQRRAPFENNPRPNLVPQKRHKHLASIHPGSTDPFVGEQWLKGLGLTIDYGSEQKTNPHAKLASLRSELTCSQLRQADRMKRMFPILINPCSRVIANYINEPHISVMDDDINNIPEQMEDASPARGIVKCKYGCNNFNSVMNWCFSVVALAQPVNNAVMRMVPGAHYEITEDPMEIVVNGNEAQTYCARCNTFSSVKVPAEYVAPDIAFMHVLGRDVIYYTGFWTAHRFLNLLSDAHALLFSSSQICHLLNNRFESAIYSIPEFAPEGEVVIKDGRMTMMTGEPSGAGYEHPQPLYHDIFNVHNYSSNIVQAYTLNQVYGHFYCLINLGSGTNYKCVSKEILGTKSQVETRTCSYLNDDHSVDTRDITLTIPVWREIEYMIRNCVISKTTVVGVAQRANMLLSLHTNFADPFLLDWLVWS